MISTIVTGIRDALKSAGLKAFAEWEVSGTLVYPAAVVYFESATTLPELSDVAGSVVGMSVRVGVALTRRSVDPQLYDDIETVISAGSAYINGSGYRATFESAIERSEGSDKLATVFFTISAI
ncbi:MAG: hypothetical protein KatS3mg104_2979 [Phycisphaerae bacterium]|nr:MAG: hypothetical protein KatS3mg104_2979 [Phycisphaerae bacterium]